MTDKEKKLESLFGNQTDKPAENAVSEKNEVAQKNKAEVYSPLSFFCYGCYHVFDEINLYC